MSGAQYNSKEKEYNGDLQLEESLWPKFKFYKLRQLRSLTLLFFLQIATLLDQFFTKKLYGS